MAEKPIRLLVGVAGKESAECKAKSGEVEGVINNHPNECKYEERNDLIAVENDKQGRGVKGLWYLVLFHWL